MAILVLGNAKFQLAVRRIERVHGGSGEAVDRPDTGSGFAKVSDFVGVGAIFLVRDEHFTCAVGANANRRAFDRDHAIAVIREVFLGPRLNLLEDNAIVGRDEGEFKPARTGSDTGSRIAAVTVSADNVDAARGVLQCIASAELESGFARIRFHNGARRSLIDQCRQQCQQFVPLCRIHDSLASSRVFS